MNAKRILNYLRMLAVNNNREWFQEHKDEYDACRADFEHGIELAIATIAQFDTEVAHVMVKDACYRFNRDTRFSEDKSPYKNHLGAYINAAGWLLCAFGTREMSVGSGGLLATYQHSHGM